MKKKSGPPARVMFSSVGAGFLAFVGVCSLMDTHALAADYTLPEPVTVVKEYYVDPQPAVQASTARQAGRAYTALNALRFDAPAPAAETETEPASAFAKGYFSSRYSALHVDPPAADTDPQVPSVQQADPASVSNETAAPASAQETAQEKEKQEKSEPVSAASGGGYSKMQSWKQVNGDVMGYLRIPGTNIDYPVVQGPNNNYYTHLDIYKNSSHNGVVWADSDVRPGSNNIVLYGHNWTNYSANPRIGNASDVMFAQLTAYQHLSFAQEHPTIQFANANGDATWVVFAALYTTDLSTYINTEISPTSLAQWAKRQSLHDFSVDVNNSDQILTLSTCTRYYGQFEDQRFVVMARKAR
ncbi:MAG: sortase [Provencibacterium sp.]|jgi:SrtB family sortase|nr:sortase [Provencibacterium sp.]